jgi:hypothetical protein
VAVATVATRAEEEGELRGEEKITIARNLVRLGKLSDEEISQVTGLLPSTIFSLHPSGS